MTINESLVSIFKSKSAGPFLFLGSGFARRYLALENWRGLLEKFCVIGKPFEYYLATADGDYSKISELLAIDFNEYWWTAEEYKNSVHRNKSNVTDITSALRIEICNYLSTFDQTKALNSEYADEVRLLSGLNVDGIITTNWDLFIEQLFPDYRVYVGQEQLLFSNPQEIGEIYKIHGSSTDPNSLVLTKNDYDEFQNKNAYLAAKLITLFVEHPIVFIGYSISDKNINSLLRSISLCIGKENIEKLRKNLIFIQRLKKNETENISDTYLTIDGVQIPLVLVKTDNFAMVYKAIDVTKRKIPARVLRFCKEQLYELVQSVEPEKKLCVVDIDDIEKKEDVEFLVGVGVAAKERAQYKQTIADIGYAVIELKDLIEDLLHDNKNYDTKLVVEHVLRYTGKSTKNIPVFKYLRKLGITSQEKYEAADLKLDKWVVRNVEEFKSKTYTKSFFKKYRHMTTQEIIDACTPENAAAYLPFVYKIDLELVKNFLIANENKVNADVSSYASNFRKLAAYYDKLMYGW